MSLRVVFHTAFLGVHIAGSCPNTLHIRLTKIPYISFMPSDEKSISITIDVSILLSKRNRTSFMLLKTPLPHVTKPVDELLFSSSLSTDKLRCLSLDRQNKYSSPSSNPNTPFEHIPSIGFELITIFLQYIVHNNDNRQADEYTTDN